MFQVLIVALVKFGFQVSSVVLIIWGDSCDYSKRLQGVNMNLKAAYSSFRGNLLWYLASQFRVTVFQASVSITSPECLDAV